MSTIKYFILLCGAAFILASCGSSSSKSSTWSDAQKAEWKQNCLKMMSANDTFEGDAEDVCDCMLEKTSEKYTPEEVIGITEEDEQKLWEECDYNW